MLHITVPRTEWFNEETSEFYYSNETSLTLEHSLVSLSKWESKWGKPFLNNSGSLTKSELISYVECMTIQPKNVDPMVYRCLAIHDEILDVITDYINKKMTATWFSEDLKKQKSKRGEVITSEVIYYWMIKLNIPVEFEKWHLNRLMTLIEVFGAKDSPPKKKNKSDFLLERRALNEKRKKALNTRG